MDRGIGIRNFNLSYVVLTRCPGHTLEEQLENTRKTKKRRLKFLREHGYECRRLKRLKKIVKDVPQPKECRLHIGGIKTFS